MKAGGHADKGDEASVWREAGLDVSDGLRRRLGEQGSPAVGDVDEVDAGTNRWGSPCRRRRCACRRETSPGGGNSTPWGGEQAGHLAEALAALGPDNHLEGITFLPQVGEVFAIGGPSRAVVHMIAEDAAGFIVLRSFDVYGGALLTRLIPDKGDLGTVAGESRLNTRCRAGE